MKNKHEDCFRGFSHLSKAWYGKSCLAAYETCDCVDEIMVGMYSEGGGTTGEFGIRWSVLDGKFVPQLQVYSDAFEVLVHQFTDLLAVLVSMDGTDPTPEQISAHLIRLGVKDLTELTMPGSPKVKEISLADALADMVDMFERHIDGRPGPDNAAERWDNARKALEQAEARQ